MDPTHQLRLPVYPAIEKAKQLFWRRKLSSEDQQESEILIASASEQAQHVVKQLESDLAQDLEEYEKKMTLWWRDLQESYQKVVSCVEESVGAGCSDMKPKSDAKIQTTMAENITQSTQTSTTRIIPRIEKKKVQQSTNRYLHASIIQFSIRKYLYRRLYKNPQHFLHVKQFQRRQLLNCSFKSWRQLRNAQSCSRKRWQDEIKSRQVFWGQPLTNSFAPLDAAAIFSVEGKHVMAQRHFNRHLCAVAFAKWMKSMGNNNVTVNLG